MTERKLHDKDIEGALLSVMVTDNSIIPNIQRCVHENDFFDGFNRIVFRSINGLYSKGCVDIVSLNAETGSVNPAFIASLTNTVASSANWKYYSDMVKSYSILRSFLKIREESENVNVKNISQMLDRVIHDCTKISDVSGGSSIKSARDLVIPMIEKVEKAVQTRGSLAGLPTGFSCLDDKLDGWQNEFYILGARPSQGKTSCATNSALRMCQKGIKVGIISAEMKDIKIMMRLLSDISGINARSLRNGLLSDQNIKRVCIAGEQLAQYPLYIDDSSIRLEAVVSSCRVMKRTIGVQIIFIDHAGMITVEEKIHSYEKESLKSKTLKKLQSELGIPIVLLSQVGRQSENKMPTLADLRGSGSYEEDADTVMFLHRERLEAEDDKPIPAEINIAKCRDGEIGICDLLFFPKLTRFTDKEDSRYDRH